MYNRLRIDANARRKREHEKNASIRGSFDFKNVLATPIEKVYESYNVIAVSLPSLGYATAIKSELRADKIS